MLQRRARMRPQAVRRARLRNTNMRALVDFPAAAAAAGAGARTRVRLELPEKILRAERLDQVAGVLAAAQEHARRGAWVAGFLAYEAAPAFDAAMRTHAPLATLPLACFGVYARARFESEPAAPAPAVHTGPWSWLHSRADVLAGIGLIREEIARGDVYQVNFTTRLRAAADCAPGPFFEALRCGQPGGYCIHLDGGSWHLLSASPELFFDWDPAGVLTTRPMKGTAARDPDPARDRALAQRMQESVKERAENLMIVDLLRNDLSRIARTGTVRVPRLFCVEALPTAWQMTSTVEAECRAGVGLPEIFAALFPCGSVTGAPKIAAMASIDRLEGAARGAYCGALGMIRPGGHATFNVGIRTVMLDVAVRCAEYGVGSGITYSSIEEGEYEEWLVKQRVLMRASGHACDPDPV